MSKYFILTPDKLDEVTGKALATELTREKIWNCIVIQSNRYKAIKFGIANHQQLLLVTDIIKMIKERNKTLKSDLKPTVVTTSDCQS